MAWGTDALKVDGQMFACVPTHRSSEPGSLAVRVAFADRDELIAHQPDTFYVKEHYLDYPCVLVRLQHIHPDALRGLLVMGWQFVTANRAKRKRRRPS